VETPAHMHIVNEHPSVPLKIMNGRRVPCPVVTSCFFSGWSPEIYIECSLAVLILLEVPAWSQQTQPQSALQISCTSRHAISAKTSWPLHPTTFPGRAGQAETLSSKFLGNIFPTQFFATKCKVDANCAFRLAVTCKTPTSRPHEPILRT
jgi:hypothetical protein